MRKGLLALLAVLVLSAGVVWGETKNAKTSTACPESASSCCCAKSCPK